MISKGDDQIADQQSVVQQRGKTDGSLTTERGKTDESIARLRTRTEIATDLKLKHDRTSSDEARAQSRTETDADIEEIRENSSGAPELTETEKQSAVEHRLLQQRQRNDEVVDSERLQMDLLLKSERDQKRTAMAGLLVQERGETDANLSSERLQTDSEVRRTSALLAAELSSHSQTKAALTSREEFLAIVSHDLRNPIGAIQSWAGALLEDHPDCAEEFKNGFERIKRNADTAMRLISDLLDMERVAEGKLAIDLQTLDLQSVIHDVLESLSHTANSKEIQLSVADSGACFAPFDRDRITQVLSNLIGNALKFTPRNGSVTVRVRRTSHELIVSVCDTGPGIALEKQAEVFERFAQLKNKDREGLGLGLYISKMLIEAHGGKMWIEAKPSHGCVFSFSIPVAV